MLYENWITQRKKKEDYSLADRLFLVHAVLLCARAKKSRMVDTALITMYAGDRPARDIPDFALDMHTTKGRKLGRGIDHFFEEGANIENAKATLLPDPYLQRAWQACRNKRCERAEIEAGV